MKAVIDLNCHENSYQVREILGPFWNLIAVI